MDKVSELLDELKKRLTNPFFFSFIFSWIVYNWRIPVGLMWSEKLGYTSYFDLIEKNTVSVWSWGAPLIFATIYTFGFPWFSILINLCQTLAITITNKQELQISKKGSIPTQLYLTQVEDLNNTINVLSEKIKGHNDLRDELSNTKTELTNKKNENAILAYDLANILNITLINGAYDYQEKTPGGAILENYRLVINDKTFYVRELNNGIVYRLFTFSFLCYLQSEIILILNPTPELSKETEIRKLVSNINQSNQLTMRLTLDSNKNLNGTILNNDHQVSFIRTGDS